MISVKRRIEVRNTPTGKRLVVASAAPRPEPPPPEVKVASVKAKDVKKLEEKG
jgi:hypothetical protein